MDKATRVFDEDDVIDYTPGSDVACGDVVVQGSLLGVAVKPIASGILGSLVLTGVFDFVKVTGAITAGAPVYWNATGDPVGGTAGTGALTTNSSYTFAGYAAEAAASDATTARVVMPGAARTNCTPQSAPITDPGNAGAIPVTGSGYVPIVTAGAETRTLAAPTFAGQVIQLAMKTDGGDCVVTVAGTNINQTGNNTITFNDAGDVVTLEGIYVGSGLRWRVLRNDGASLTTV